MIGPHLYRSGPHTPRGGQSLIHQAILPCATTYLSTTRSQPPPIRPRQAHGFPEPKGKPQDGSHTPPVVQPSPHKFSPISLLSKLSRPSFFCLFAPYFPFLGQKWVFWEQLPKSTPDLQLAQNRKLTLHPCQNLCIFPFHFP